MDFPIIRRNILCPQVLGVLTKICDTGALVPLHSSTGMACGVWKVIELNQLHACTSHNLSWSVLVRAVQSLRAMTFQCKSRTCTPCGVVSANRASVSVVRPRLSIGVEDALSF